MADFPELREAAVKAGPIARDDARACNARLQKQIERLESGVPAALRWLKPDDPYRAGREQILGRLTDGRTILREIEGISPYEVASRAVALRRVEALLEALPDAAVTLQRAYPDAKVRHEAAMALDLEQALRSAVGEKKKSILARLFGG